MHKAKAVTGAIAEAVAEAEGVKRDGRWRQNATVGGGTGMLNVEGQFRKAERGDAAVGDDELKLAVLEKAGELRSPTQSEVVDDDFTDMSTPDVPDLLEHDLQTVSGLGVVVRELAQSVRAVRSGIVAAETAHADKVQQMETTVCAIQAKLQAIDESLKKRAEETEINASMVMAMAQQAETSVVDMQSHLNRLGNAVTQQGTRLAESETAVAAVRDMFMELDAQIADARKMAEDAKAGGVDNHLKCLSVVAADSIIADIKEQLSNIGKGVDEKVGSTVNALDGIQAQLTSIESRHGMHACSIKGLQAHISGINNLVDAKHREIGEITVQQQNKQVRQTEATISRIREQVGSFEHNHITQERFEEFSAGIAQTLENYQQRAEDVAAGIRQLHSGIGYVTMDEFQEFRTSYTESRVRTEQVIASIQRTLAEMSEALKGTADVATVSRLQDTLASTQRHLNNIGSESSQPLHAYQVQLKSIESKYSMQSQTITGLQEQLSNIGAADAARLQSLQVQVKSLEGRMDSRSTMQAERITRIEVQLEGLASMRREDGPLTVEAREGKANPNAYAGSLTVMESQLSSLENIVKLQRVRMKEALTAITDMQEKLQNFTDNHYITLDEFSDFSRSIAGALEAAKVEAAKKAQASSEDTDFVTIDEFSQVCNGITSKVKEHATAIASFQQSMANTIQASPENARGNDSSQGRPVSTIMEATQSSKDTSSISKATQERLARIENKIEEKLSMAEFKECFNAIEESVKELAQFTTSMQEHIDSLEHRMQPTSVAAA